MGQPWIDDVEKGDNVMENTVNTTSPGDARYECHNAGGLITDQSVVAGIEDVSTILQSRKYRLGQFRLDLLTLSELMSLFGHAIRCRFSMVVLHHNLHGLYVQQQMPHLNEIYDNADWVYIDGMPLIWLARAAGLSATASHRITLLDCFEKLLAGAEDHGWRVFYFGGKEEVLTEGLTAIQARFPSLAIIGHDGYVDSNREDSLIEKINAFAPDILFVGLGMPLQEDWIVRNRSRLRVPVITTCGATMEYVTGHSRRPPAWMGSLGMYGIYRLISQPKRLWRRYLFEPLVLLPQLASVLWKRSHDSR